MFLMILFQEKKAEIELSKQNGNLEETKIKLRQIIEFCERMKANETIVREEQDKMKSEILDFEKILAEYNSELQTMHQTHKGIFDEKITKVEIILNEVNHCSNQAKLMVRNHTHHFTELSKI